MTVASQEAWADDVAAPAAAAARPEVKADAKAEAKPAQAAAAEVDTNPIYLHVASPSPVRIENSDTGEIVCTSPCDKNVPGSIRYRIGGYQPSDSFILSTSSGRADVKVKPGSKATFWTGIGGLALGGALIGTGVAVLIYGVSTRAPVGGADTETVDNSYTDEMAIGTGLTILGTVAGLWGLATVVSNASTSVRGDIGAASSQPIKARSDAPVRTVSQIPSGLPKPTFVPLLGGTF